MCSTQHGRVRPHRSPTSGCTGRRLEINMDHLIASRSVGWFPSASHHSGLDMAFPPGFRPGLSVLPRHNQPGTFQPVRGHGTSRLQRKPSLCTEPMLQSWCKDTAGNAANRGVRPLELCIRNVVQSEVGNCKNSEGPVLLSSWFASTMCKGRCCKQCGQILLV